MKRIVWDWNGTLLNDVNLCFECINRLLVSKNLDPLIDLAAYRDIFEFPIQNYYKNSNHLYYYLINLLTSQFPVQYLTTLAGTPAATAQDGTSFVTTRLRL